MNIITAYPHGLVTFARQKTFTMPYMARQGWTASQDRFACQVHGTDPQALYDRLSTMGLSKDTYSHKPVKRPASQRGLMGISTYGKRLVRWGCQHLQDEYGRNRLSFITTTLPSTQIQLRRDDWSEACRQFYQALRRDLKRHDLPGDFVGVTEVQEARQSKYGGVPLHLHVVVVGRHAKGAWVLTKERVKELWKNAVMNVIKNDKEYDWSASTRIESVRKSAAGYLGKYMSKGLKAVAALHEQGLQEFIPALWYACSTAIRNLYKSNIRKRSGNHIANVFDNVLQCVHELFTATGFVELTGYGDGKMRVAWWGQLKENVSVNDFMSMFSL